MTDKQIIIDGIDVSGCEWYSSRYFKPCGGCKNTPDCHYKNWQRKEQECERLKNERTVDLVKQLDQLKAENEELKKQNNQFDNGINEQFSKIVELEGRNNLLKVILTEIKEIMKKHCRKCKKHKFYHFQLCCTCKYTDILQKISECEVESEEI